jgi:hypothetical protein
MNQEEIISELARLASSREDLNWDVETITKLVEVCRKERSLDSVLYTEFSQVSNLLPVEGQPTISWEWISAQVPRIQGATWGRKDNWEEQVMKWAEMLEAVKLEKTAETEDKRPDSGVPGGGRFTLLQGTTRKEQSLDLETARTWVRDHPDEDVYISAIWPARSSGTWAVRRARFGDLWEWLARIGKDDWFIEQMEFMAGWDYAMVRNIVTAGVIIPGWWDRWKAIGAYEDGFYHWADVAGKVNNWLKSRESTGIDLRFYAEAKGLGGYNFAAGLNEDIKKNGADYADGGRQQGFGPTPKHTFLEAAKLLGVTPDQGVPPLTFEEWVADPANWATTTGSSSEGRVKWVFKGMKVKKGDIKARKNLAGYVLEPGPLAEKALLSTIQENWLLVKEEKAKVRLAVAGDLLTYLKMGWLLYWTDHAYKKWPGNTIEETREQARTRYMAMIGACKGYVEPFDYEGFEKQPTLEKLKLLSEIIFGIGVSNVPMTMRKQWEDIKANVIAGFDEAYLIATSELLGQFGDKTDEDVVWKILGGLMSGLRITSVIGNAYNTSVTRVVLAIIETLGISTHEIETWFRGDDSFIAHPRWEILMLVRIALAAFGAKGGEGKFGIFHKKGEFLRVMYSLTGMTGYVLRSIPGIWSRTPWSSSPPGPEDALRAACETLMTIVRRGETPEPGETVLEESGYVMISSLPNREAKLAALLDPSIVLLVDKVTVQEAERAFGPMRGGRYVSVHRVGRVVIPYVSEKVGDLVMVQNRGFNMQTMVLAAGQEWGAFKQVVGNLESEQKDRGVEWEVEPVLTSFNVTEEMRKWTKIPSGLEPSGVDVRAVLALRDVLCERTAARKRYQVEWLRLPQRLGGFGILPWQGASPQVGRVNVFSAPELELFPTQGSIDATEAHYKSWELNKSEAKELTLLKMRDLIVADDVRVLNSLIRAGYLYPKNTRWTKVRIHISLEMRRSDMSSEVALSTLRPDLSDQAIYFITPVKWYGSERKLAGAWMERNEVGRVRKVNYKDWLFEHPSWDRNDRYLTGRGLARNAAIDWMLGTYSLGTPTDIHPEAIWIIDRFVASQLDSRLGARAHMKGKVFDLAWSILWEKAALAFKKSDYYRMLARW